MSDGGWVHIDVEIVRFVSDEPQPGIVEFVLVDAYGARHSFIDKTAVPSDDNPLATSNYPCVGEIGGELESEWLDENGRGLARINTAPWGVEASDGSTCFVVLSSKLRR